MILRAFLLSAALCWPALVFGEQAEHDWANDPRVQDVIERWRLDATPEGREIFMSQVLAWSEARREVFVRHAFFNTIVLNDYDVLNSTTDLTQAMVIASEGCLLPIAVCELLKTRTLRAQSGNRFFVGLAVLSQATAHFADEGNCVQGRKGIVDSVSFVWGDIGFVLSSTSNAENAPCFVQRLKV